MTRTIIYKMGSCYVFLLIAFYFVALATAGIMGDECDWTGSGLTAGSARGVTPVYLRCRAGRLTWRDPRGALRLILQLHSQRDFRVCVRAGKSEDRPDLYSENDLLDFRESARHYRSEADSDAELAQYPARLFLEGRRGLLPLLLPGDGGGRVRCFRSQKGRAAIYLEASPAATAAATAHLQYDLQPLPRSPPAAEDCRPCEPHEMAHAFCTSDLVTLGEIVGAQERSELDTTELTVRITKLIRYTAPSGLIFTADTGAPHNSSEEYRRIGGLFSGGDDEGGWLARAHASAQCGAAGGAGAFLVAARRRLGALALVCAPRAEHWAEVARRLNEDGSAHCLLTS